MSLFLGWLLSLFQTQIKNKKCIPSPERHKNYPTYIHPKTVGMIYKIIKKNPQSVGWIYPYFYKCIFPNPTPEHSNNHSKWWVSNTNIKIQLTYILSNLFAAYIPQIIGSIYSIQIYISTNLYSPTVYPKGAQKLQQYVQPPSFGLIYPIPTYMYSTDIYSPNCWLHISNNIFIF